MSVRGWVRGWGKATVDYSSLDNDETTLDSVSTPYDPRPLTNEETKGENKIGTFRT